MPLTRQLAPTVPGEDLQSRFRGHVQNGGGFFASRGKRMRPPTPSPAPAVAVADAVAEKALEMDELRERPPIAIA